MLALLLALFPIAPQHELIPAPPELKRLDDLDLAATDPPPNPLSGAWLHAFLGKNRIAVMRSDRRIDILELDGHLLRSIEGNSDTRFMASASDDRLFVVDDATAADRKRARVTVQVVDLPLGDLRPFATCTASALDGVVASKDKGCVVLLREAPANQKSSSRLEGFDPEGKRTFSIEVMCESDCRGLLGTSDGRVGVVTAATVTHIRWFNSEGRACGSLDLDTPGSAWSSRGTTGVIGVGKTFFVQGGVDFVGHYGAAGEWLGGFHMRWPDGLSLHQECFSGPDDHLWTQDGYAFLRLDEKGLVDKVLGETRDVARLADASIVLVPDGSIFATTSRDNATHVLDGTGHEVRFIPALSPDPKAAHSDFGLIELPGLPLELQWIAQEWVGPPRLGRHFDFDYEPRSGSKYRLVDANGKVVRVLADPAGPDSWPMAHAAALASDGSIAVLWSQRAGGQHVVVYDAEGDYRRTIPLPDEAMYETRLAWNGRRLAAVDDLRFWVLEENGTLSSATWLSERRQHDFRCTGGVDMYWRIAFSSNPHELWLMQGTSAREPIRRYALP